MRDEEKGAIQANEINSGEVGLQINRDYRDVVLSVASLVSIS